MGKKAVKSARKFAASGQLKKTIQARRKHRDIKKKTEKRQAAKGKGKQTQTVEDDGEGEEENDQELQETSGKCVACLCAEGREFLIVPAG